jgi:hypothetical protein
MSLRDPHKNLLAFMADKPVVWLQIGSKYMVFGETKNITPAIPAAGMQTGIIATLRKKGLIEPADEETKGEIGRFKLTQAGEVKAAHFKRMGHGQKDEERRRHRRR